MYGLARLRGIGPAVILAGRRFSVHARTLGDYAEIEAHMLELRGNPFDVLRWLCRDARNRPLATKLVEKLRVNEDDWWDVTIGDAMEWLATYEGRIFGLWLAVRREDAAVSLEWVRQCVIDESQKAESTQSFGAELWWDRIQSSLDVANGDDELSALENFGIEETKGKSRHPNWRLAFRDLCLSYPNNESACLSPDQFWNLTLGQYRQLTRSRESLAGVTYSRGSEMDAHCQRMNKATETAIDNLTGGKRWNAK